MGHNMHVIIIGGGASGVLLAAHLLRDPDRDLRVTLIEKRAEVGRGVAYSARQLDHVLNVPAINMSVYADDPEHFWRWLSAEGLSAAAEGFGFVARRHYGTYLDGVVADLLVGGRLHVVHELCTGVTSTAGAVAVTLAGGATLAGDVAVLAVGHEEQPARSKGVAVRVGSEADTPLPADVPVMILGSGLSMVDAWLELAQAEHRGPVTVVSRHGLLPHPHRRVGKIEFDADEVPIGLEVRDFIGWFRRKVEAVMAGGGDWRSVVDALRPFNQRIWREWSERSRQRFLEHARSVWNIHRHRLPPELHQRLQTAVASGQVTLVAGKFLDVRAEGSEAVATIRRRGSASSEEIRVARVYDCGGVVVDVEQSSNPVITGLLADGAARPDPLHIGLDVTPTCEVIAANGAPSKRMFAIGPLTRGAFFEIESVPDIRVQCAELAERLCRVRPRLRPN